jgi:uncharacterized protein
VSAEPRARALEYPLGPAADPAALLAHADRAARDRGLDGWFVADVDAHLDPSGCWHEVVARYSDDVMVHNSMYRGTEASTRGMTQYVSDALLHGYDNYDLFGRIPHHRPGAPGEATSPGELIAAATATMDAFGIDVQLVFPSTLVNLGRSPLPAGEAQIAHAYNRWFSERVAAAEPRVKFLALLPLRRPEVCERIIDEMTGKPGVVGFLVTSLRYDRVQDNRHMRLYAKIAEADYPLAFHGGPSWEEPSMRTMDELVTVDAVSCPYPNMVHLANWVMSGMPERFPGLKVIWIDGGLAWVPFLMQRLDSGYLKRTSEAPLLTRMPSDYMREMYYTCHPLESRSPKMLRATLEELSAETQLLFASGWPQWNFDLPGSILDLDFLGEQAKRNILGETARKLFNL